MLPDFIVGGIMKSGTTYLDTFLRNHPDIHMPLRSMDYSFFDNDKIFKKGIKWYEGLFSNPEKKKLIGQTSADCAFNPGSLERIKTYIPDCKLIFVIRHPIDRVYSHYWHARKMGREYKSFENAIKSEKRRVKLGYYYFKKFSYVGKSRYKKQFELLGKVFEENQILIIPFETLIKNELLVLNKVFDFLEIKNINDPDSLLTPEDRKTNSARIPTSEFLSMLTYFLQKIGLVRIGRIILNRNLVEKRPPQMPAELRTYLENELCEDIAFFEKFKAEFDRKIGL